MAGHFKNDQDSQGNDYEERQPASNLVANFITQSCGIRSSFLGREREGWGEGQSKGVNDVRAAFLFHDCNRGSYLSSKYNVSLG